MNLLKLDSAGSSSSLPTCTRGKYFTHRGVVHVSQLLDLVVLDLYIVGFPSNLCGKKIKWWNVTISFQIRNAIAKRLYISDKIMKRFCLKSARFYFIIIRLLCSPIALCPLIGSGSLQNNVMSSLIVIVAISLRENSYFYFLGLGYQIIQILGTTPYYVC